ncbi:uncharacterized protein TNCV_4990951 [Trichonephila clavipes]|nr:uncharacterized protein TNCV_4990951 [Trichonephila clavipes]
MPAQLLSSSLERDSKLRGMSVIISCHSLGFENHLILNTPSLVYDEAHFWLNGYVNKQNCRIWREANPQVYGETPLHPEKLTVWCALWAGGIIGPYFFKNDEGHNVTVNGAVVPTRRGATCHTARATIDLLKDTFGDRLISRFGPVNWPPRSCDLTPLDYFLWGYVKSLVYADKPQTLDHLEDNIRRVIADIRPQMLEKVIENWTSRLDYIRASRGSPMPEIIFKMSPVDVPSTGGVPKGSLACLQHPSRMIPVFSRSRISSLFDQTRDKGRQKGVQTSPSSSSMFKQPVANSNSLARTGAGETTMPAAPLTYLGLFSKYKAKNKAIWMIPHVHPWYQRKYPGGSPWFGAVVDEIKLRLFDSLVVI